MANIEAMTFNFAGNNSLDYQLYLVEYDNHRPLTRESAGNNIRIISDSIPRRAEEYVYGVQQDRVQQFSIVVGSDIPKTRAEIDRILAWLIQPQPEELFIREWDSEWYSYTGFFTNPQIIAVDNMSFGLQFAFVCTSPYAFTTVQRRTFRIDAPTTHIFVNDSGDSINYMKPTIRYTPRNTTQFFSIVNKDDSDREFRLDLAPASNGDELLIINNDLQIITSSMGNDFSRHRFTSFNKNWFRVKRGTNRLHISGPGFLEIEYRFARRIGS